LSRSSIVAFALQTALAMATPSLLERMVAAGLRPLLLGGRRLLPVLQGGMGVGISAYSLAGVVASPGAWGTIACVPAFASCWSAY
jgi:hypothetical protein